VAETAARTDPLLAFRFEVRLGDLPVGGFSECGGLQVETEVHDYQEGGLNTNLRRFVTRTRHANLIFKAGIVDRVLWDWHAEVVRGRFRRRSGTVAVRDPSGGRVLAEWHFSDAFPCKWQGPELNAGQNAVAVETFELCHQGLDRRR
jgi:phage tail-like protein